MFGFVPLLNEFLAISDASVFVKYILHQKHISYFRFLHIYHNTYVMLLSYLLRSPGEISCGLSAQGGERLSHILSNLVKQETRDTWLVHGTNEINKD